MRTGSCWIGYRISTTRLKASYDENFFRQEVLGDYLNIRGGLVYPAFRREVNVREMDVIPALPVLWTLDFNVAPLCSLVVQKWRDEVRVLDEIVLRRATTEQACEEFEKRYGMPPGGVVVCGDANGASMHTASDSTDLRGDSEVTSDRGSKFDRLKTTKSNPAVRATAWH